MTPQKRAEKAGRQAETFAAFCLRLKGYTLLGHRVRTPYGELDLIASKKDILAFIEVKKRRNYEDGIASLRQRQKKRLIRAASSWKGRDGNRFSCYQPRFDLFVVTGRFWPCHLKGIFDVGHDDLRHLI